MSPEVRVLGAGDDALLLDAHDLFDRPPDATLVADFLADPRHHIAVAIANATVVGFASGVHHVHPDKQPELFVNEVGVLGPYRGAGVGKAVVRALLAEGRRLGCETAWVLTEDDNEPAIGLYSSLGADRDDGTVLFELDLTELDS